MDMFICGDDYFHDEKGCGGHVFVVLSSAQERPPYIPYITVVCATCGAARRELLEMYGAAAPMPGGETP